MTQRVGRIYVAHEKLKQLLDYSPQTGELYWKVNRHRAKAGTRAGYPANKGYRRVTICNNEYGEHRVIWYWMTGESPTLEIDHKDGDRANNKWDNLRLATGVQNSANSAFKRKNKTGYRGVGQMRCNSRYYAQLCVDGRQQILGYFDTAEEAYAKYCAEAERLRGEYYRPCTLSGTGALLP